MYRSLAFAFENMSCVLTIYKGADKEWWYEIFDHN